MNTRQVQELIKAHRVGGQRFRHKFRKYLDWYLANEEWFSRDGYQNYDHRTHTQDEDLTLDTNMPYAYIDTMIAGVCPTNPQVTIQAGHPDYSTQMKNRERWVNGEMRRNRLYKRGWRSAAHASICGYGITKTVWNVRRKKPKTSVIDPRRVVWDHGVEDWDEISFIGEANILRKDQFEARMSDVRLPDGRRLTATYNPKVAKKAKFGAWPNWLGKGWMGENTKDEEEVKNVFEFTVVWEFYDFVTNTYWHVMEGVEEPLLEAQLPYKYVRNPYDLVVFNDNLEDTKGVSDIKLIERAQERLNEIDSIIMKHAKRTMPIAIVDETGIEEPADFISALQNVEEPGSAIKVKLTGNRRDIREVMTYTQVPTLPPGLDASRDRAQAIIEFVLALAAFQRGGVGNVQVATEAALADSGIRSRNGRRIKVMSDWQASVGRKYVGLLAEMWPGKMPIPVFDPGSANAELLTIEDMAFNEAMTVEEEWYMLTEAAPYSPAENSKLVRLQKLERWLPTLLGNPNVDNAVIMKDILTELDLLPAFDAEGGQQQQAVDGQPGQPGSAGQSANDIASGNLPPHLRGQNDAFQQQTTAPGVSERPVGGK